MSYKKLLRDGPSGIALGGFPAIAAIPAAPPAVAPGIFPRNRKLVQRIKFNPNYTQAIGADFGIIGAEQTVVKIDMQPKLKLVFKGGAVEVQWKKGKADAIRIEVDRGDGAGWVFLAIDMVPHYVDKTPITTPANWQYRAAYLISDQLVGQWSAVETITVG